MVLLPYLVCKAVLQLHRGCLLRLLMHLLCVKCLLCRRVALYAVDSLRQLVAKLLARAELERFTYQEEALRPFVAVLRQCDEACVRELAVQCVMQVSTQATGLLCMLLTHHAPSRTHAGLLFCWPPDCVLLVVYGVFVPSHVAWDLLTNICCCCCRLSPHTHMV